MPLVLDGTTGIVATNIADGAITVSKLASGVATPAGTIGYFGANAAPTGWLKCNGATVSRSTYSALFTAIGTTYGAGDGSTTFAIPDLRGEFLRGLDDGRGVDTGRGIGTGQSGANASHSHTASTAGTGAHAHTVSHTTGIEGSYSGPTLLQASYSTGLLPSTVSSSSAGTHSHTVTVNTDGGTETRPRNVALLACIKF